MARYAYKVVPAPRKGQRAKGVRGTDQKFANALQVAMNLQAAEGWEYLRTDTLPCEERHGLGGKVTVFQNMLVFRRALDDAGAPGERPETAPQALPEPPPEISSEKAPDASPEPAPESTPESAPDAAPVLRAVRLGRPAALATQDSAITVAEGETDATKSGRHRKDD